MARILVVDDDPAVRSVMKLVLERAGHAALVAAHGMEALELLKREACDLAIVDIDMPGMNGFEVCRAIKTDVRIASVKLVMITGRPIDGVPDRAREAGALDLMHKPFRRDQLLGNIDHYLAGRVPPPTENES